MADAASLKDLFHECMPLFIALGDEIRLTIVESLCDAAFKYCGGAPSAKSLQMHGTHGLNVNEITRRTKLSRPATSHHLKILKDAGLVGVRREGTCNYYYLTISESTETLMQLGTLLQTYFH